MCWWSGYRVTVFRTQALGVVPLLCRLGIPPQLGYLKVVFGVGQKKGGGGKLEVLMVHLDHFDAKIISGHNSPALHRL